MIYPFEASLPQGAEADMIAAEDRAAGRVGRRLVREAPAEKVAGVYFLHAVNSPYIAIGSVEDVAKVEHRVGTLQPGCPFKLELLYVLSPAGRAEVSRLHKRFSDQYVRGAWFTCEGEL